MRARRAFATRSSRDSGAVHIRDHGRKRSREFAGEVFDASAIPTVPSHAR
jgi:hypothetical protein